MSAVIMIRIPFSFHVIVTTYIGALCTVVVYISHVLIT